jgi:hypothetical protein
MSSTAARAADIAGSDSDSAPYIGAKPAATSSALRSRSGTARLSASLRTMPRLGCERPVSTKLKCRAEISMSVARSSWLRWRRCRHSRS